MLEVKLVYLSGQSLRTQINQALASGVPAPHSSPGSPAKNLPLDTVESMPVENITLWLSRPPIRPPFPAVDLLVPDGVVRVP